MLYDVFISYSSKDQKVAEGVCGFLESNGIRCFVAYRDIPPGVVWAAAIADGLEKSSMMVTIFSMDFNMSTQVDREIELAANDKKPILTFRISDAMMTGAKMYYLQNLNRLDAFPNPENGFGALLSNVRLLLGKQESAFVPPVTNNATTTSDNSTKQTITDVDGTYVGDVVNGKKHGYGVLTYNDGDVYEGYFVDGVQNGKGKITFPNGDVCEGDFVDGAITGKGKITWSNGEFYEGDFVDDVMSGKGKFTWYNGDVYEGDFVDGYRTGKGKYTWSDGNVYEGDFVDGFQTGKGKYTWSNGDIYVGHFVNGKFDGYGTLYFKDGRIQKGFWKKGEYKGKLPW